MTHWTEARQNFEKSHIPMATRSWILALGICKIPKPLSYRRSKAGTKVFHAISSGISNRENNNHPNTSGLGIKLCNLKPLSRSIITTHRSVRLLDINSWSFTNKIDSFHTQLLHNEVDFCAVTETLIKPDDIDSVTHKVAPMGYKVLSFPRLNGRNDGGIVLVHWDYYTVKQLKKLPDITTMEYQSFRLCFNYLTVNLCIIYRLPSTSVLQFSNEILTIQEDLIYNQADRNIFIGNFNIHMDIEDDATHWTFWIHSSITI